jgi:hypothetical protein
MHVERVAWWIDAIRECYELIYTHVVDERRIRDLTRRIETSGERIVEVLGRVEQALTDRTAVEVAVVETAASPSLPARSRRPVPTRREQWRRFAFVTLVALLGTALALRRQSRGL